MEVHHFLEAGGIEAASSLSGVTGACITPLSVIDVSVPLEAVSMRSPVGGYFTANAVLPDRLQPGHLRFLRATVIAHR
jgi:hypothetical protein